MPRSEEGHIIKLSRQNNCNGVVDLLKMFPTKLWTLGGLKTLV